MCLYYLIVFKFSTRWKANEFSFGSYTAIGVGSSQLDIEHIARPMHVNNNKIVSYDKQLTVYLLISLMYCIYSLL